MEFLFLGLAAGALFCTLKFTVLENKFVAYEEAAGFIHLDADVIPAGQLNDDMAAVSVSQLQCRKIFFSNN